MEEEGPGAGACQESSPAHSLKKSKDFLRKWSTFLGNVKKPKENVKNLKKLKIWEGSFLTVLTFLSFFFFSFP